MWDDGSSNETSVKIAWQLNCADEDIIYGYNISFCALAKSNNICMHPPEYQIKILPDKTNIYTYRLISLRPFTKYNVSVAMISTSMRNGPFSNSIILETMEGSKLLIAI